MKKNFTFHFSLFAILAVLPWLSMSCTEGGYADEREVPLCFSVDTLSFDTLFTTVGSTTRQVVVYNATGHDVVISSITLDKGRASRFRLNVDGDTSLVAHNVELLSGDSLYIFVQVNVNPNDETSPFLEEDAIVFGNGQRLPLRAWGRNAYYHLPTDTLVFSDGSFMLCNIVDCAEWNLRQHDKPHVIIGYAVVLEGNTLTLQAGDELYFYNDAIMAIDSNASLVAVGTAQQPVLFTSVRHDGWYSFLPGQWQCIWFTSGSTGNIIESSIVENGTGGLRVYPNASVNVSNTVIRNMSDCALIGQGGSITGNNLLVYDCLGMFTVLRGGSYNFTGCTFADYWTYSIRKLPGVVLTNYLLNNDGTVREAGDLVQADFSKCIIYGSYGDGEVLASGIEGWQLNYHFDSCLVKGGEWDENPMFKDIGNDDYHLEEDSPAVGIGYQFETE